MEKMEMNSQEKLRMLLIRCGQKLSSSHSNIRHRGECSKYCITKDLSRKGFFRKSSVFSPVP